MNTFRRDNRTAFTFRHGGSMEVAQRDGDIIVLMSGVYGDPLLTLDADELSRLAAELVAFAARLEYEDERQK